jgi:UDP-N-acetylglucosamine 2-epimerase (non-hydrolysing)
MGRIGLEYRLLRIRQHADLVSVSSDFVVELAEDNSGNRLDQILSTIGKVPDHVFLGITKIMVQGDTASALLMCLAGYHRQIPVIHIEAGLRTWNLQSPFPEEGYRQIISRLASIHFCPTRDNFLNLEKEMASGEKFVVGNPGLDNIVHLRSQVEYGNMILCTLHRRENHEQMKQWFEALECCAKQHPEYRFVLPIHPNPNVSKHRSCLAEVRVVEPIEYEVFVSLMSKCALCISDSGGIQEEATFLGKKVIVCRASTERPEGIGSSLFLCTSPEKLGPSVDNHLRSLKISQSNIFGNGTSASQIVSILNRSSKID